MSYTNELTGCLVDYETGDRYEFGFNPEEFDEENSTEYAIIATPRCFLPKIQYGNTKERRLSFKLHIHYGMYADVEQAILNFVLLVYPYLEGNRVTEAPHKLLVAFGNTWAGDKWLMETCRVIRKKFTKELKCIHAELDITLVEGFDEG